MDKNDKNQHSFNTYQTLAPASWKFPIKENCQKLSYYESNSWLKVWKWILDSGYHTTLIKFWVVLSLLTYFWNLSCVFRCISDLIFDLIYLELVLALLITFERIFFSTTKLNKFESILNKYLTPFRLCGSIFQSISYRNLHRISMIWIE